MSGSEEILHKLELFMKRYYLNRLLKGLILFTSLVLVYFLVLTALEYFLWMNTTLRAVLFWGFLLSVAGLVFWFVLIPVFGIFNIRRGLTPTQAANIIGKHFPEVNDKLLNLLQLREFESKDELVVAGIQQKAMQLKPIPFSTAINFNRNLPYLKYLFPSLIVILAIIITGKTDFFNGYQRVLHYNTAFTPPAPFSYVIQSGALEVLENEDYFLEVETLGSVQLDNLSMVLGNRTVSLKKAGTSQFVYTFKNVTQDQNFHFAYGDFRSPEYALKVVRKPAILKNTLYLDYPSYIGKKDETRSGTANLTLPQGTVVKWSVETKNTQAVQFWSQDTVETFIGKGQNFSFEKRFMQPETYWISSSNEQLKDFERLQYRVEIIPDLSPVITARQFIDSLNPEQHFFAGNASDDYGLSALQLVYHPVENNQSLNRLPVKISKGEVAAFSVVFPDSLSLQPGTTYAIYFEVSDNDAVNGSKTSRSETFYYNRQTLLEREDNLLNQQGKLLDKMTENAKKAETLQQQLQEISQQQKSKSELNWNEKQDLKQLLNRQQQQEALMQNFSNDLLKTLNQSTQQDSFNQELENRLKENAREAEQNQQLLDELNKIADKLSEEELSEKLDQVSKQSRSRQKSLQQLLELAKNYYVRQKLTSIAQKVNQLAEKQEELSDKGAALDELQEQEKLTEAFEKAKQELNDLDKENEKLRKPINYQRDKILEKEISKEQQTAEEILNNQQSKEANKPETQTQNESKKAAQKKAAKKMKEMSSQMQQNMSASMGEQLQEDMEVLRQILQNLLVFSKGQEDLMEETEKVRYKSLSFSQVVKNQYFLKENFTFIDDSLFSLSLRRPEFSEKINKEIENIYQYLDQSLGELSEYQIYKATSSQQYTLSSANVLADFLSDILSNMQEQMSMSGQSGKGNQEFQLPDIIQMQESLQEQMSGQSQSDSKKGEAQKEGEQGQPNQEGNQPNDAETDYGNLLEVLKKQQEINDALKDIMQREGLTQDENRLLKQAEQLEQELLMQGYNSDVLEKMKNFKHELLKLSEAVNEQGQNQERKSRTNTKNYAAPLLQLPELKEYLNQIEILNRQPLPLRPEILKKVKQYFIQANDTL